MPSSARPLAAYACVFALSFANLGFCRFLQATQGLGALQPLVNGMALMAASIATLMAPFVILGLIVEGMGWRNLLRDVALPAAGRHVLTWGLAAIALACAAATFLIVLPAMAHVASVIGLDLPL